MSEDSPIPNRISGFFEIIDDRGDAAVKGSLKCSCGCKSFSMHYFGKLGLKFFSPTIVATKHNGGKRVVLTAKCSECSKQILVYDSSIDGYENYDKLKREFIGEYHDFTCDSCGMNRMHLDIAYNSDGKKELTRQNKTNWKECFLEIFVSGKCASCNKVYKRFLEG